jgi:hypothetical protein
MSPVHQPQHWAENDGCEASASAFTIQISAGFFKPFS